MCAYVLNQTCAISCNILFKEVRKIIKKAWEKENIEPILDLFGFNGFWAQELGTALTRKDG